MDILLDQTDKKLQLWETVSQNFTNFSSISMWMKLKDYPVIGNMAKKIVLNRVYFVYDCSTSLVVACEQALHEFSEHFPFKKDDLQRVFDEFEEAVQLA